MRRAFLWPSARSLVVALALFSALGACATYREDLNRGRRMYEENQYENALAIWRVLESDSDSLSPNDRARYAYLRGMTDYRLGFRADSRHWLALGKAMEGAYPGALSEEWRERLEQSLTDLNQDVYGPGEHFGDARPSVAEPRTQPDNGQPTASGGAAADAPRFTPARHPDGCVGNADCPTGQICDSKTCVPL